MAAQPHSIDTSNCTKVTALTIADLNTTINHEPRISDRKIGFSLGMKNPTSTMRKLIERHKEPLERFGPVLSVAEKTGPRGGRPGKAYWLTKKQALYICTKSETPNATEVTIAMVEVFDAWQAGHLIPATPSTLAPGLMRMLVGKHEALIDARDYQIGPGDEALVCDHEGKLKIVHGPLHRGTDAPWLGARVVLGPWEKPKNADTTGILQQRGNLTVLGRVIRPGERRRRAIAA